MPFLTGIMKKNSRRIVIPLENPKVIQRHGLRQETESGDAGVRRQARRVAGGLPERRGEIRLRAARPIAGPARQIQRRTPPLYLAYSSPNNLPNTTSSGTIWKWVM